MVSLNSVNEEIDIFGLLCSSFSKETEIEQILKICYRFQGKSYVTYTYINLCALKLCSRKVLQLSLR